MGYFAEKQAIAVAEARAETKAETRAETLKVVNAYQKEGKTAEEIALTHGISLEEVKSIIEVLQLKR